MTDGARPVTVRNLVLVDADLGNVALSFSEIEDAKNRIVCNAESEPKLVPCTALEAELKEGENPTAAAPEAALAYNLTGDLYDFYKDNFGRDSIDGSGMPLISTVSYCEEEECPFENAFWDGEQMVYGDGLVTDDVTGHELTHGVNGSESHLFYYYQSGALDEASPTSSASSSTSARRASRRQATSPRTAGRSARTRASARSETCPTPRHSDSPTGTGSGEWFYEPDADLASSDNGGVHENSGVGSKAAFLITDGANFNGQTISGLGIEKALQIHYDAITNLLTSASDYQDYGNALRQACSDLVGEHEITATDCEQVEKTVKATEMETPPPSAAPTRASACAGGQTPEIAFSDDLENPGSGNWVAGSLLFEHPSVFFYPQVPNTAGLDATYASSGTTNIWGVDASSVTDSAIAMTKSVTVPNGGFMRFAHAHSFESGEGNSYDGGVIEYSTDGGAHWTDAGSLIEAGDQYGGPIFTGAANPLSGRPAFVGESTGYGSTRLNPPRLPASRSGSASGSAPTKRRKTTAGSSTTSRSTAAEGAGPLPAPASASAAAARRNRDRCPRAVAGTGRRRRLRHRPRRPGQGAGEAGESAPAPAHPESAERRRPQGDPQGRGRREEEARRHAPGLRDLEGASPGGPRSCGRDERAGTRPCPRGSRRWCGHARGRSPHRGGSGCRAGGR